jgi:hypothetical protein
MFSKRSGDDTLPLYKWRWGGIDYSISHWIYLLAVLKLEFERGRVPAKGRAFLMIKMALRELYQYHQSLEIQIIKIKIICLVVWCRRKQCMAAHF